MLRAQITTLTLYNRLADENDNLFKYLALPARPFTDRGYEDLFLTGWDIDKDTLVDNILLETAELNVLYTDPEFMQFAIKAWSEKELPVWQSLYETLFFKYNPVWNKDGTFKHTATETRNLANGATVTETDSRTTGEATHETVGRDIGTHEVIKRDENSQRDYTETMAGTVTDARTLNTNTNTENKVAAFDSSTYQNREQTDTDNTGTDTTVTTYDTTKTINDDLVSHSDDTTRDTTTDDDTTRDMTVNGTESGTRSHTTSGSDTGTVTNVTTDTETGNIGVTMSQQLIEAERNLVKFNIYDYIINSFKARFCVLVY